MSDDGYIVVDRDSMTDEEKRLDDFIGEYARRILKEAQEPTP